MTTSRRSSELALRRQLLGTAAVAALAALPGQAIAGQMDDDWHVTLDLGGQYAFVDGGKTTYAEPSFLGPQKIGVQNGGEGWAGLTFQKGDWIFGLNFNYGRTGVAHEHFSYSSEYYSKFYSGHGAVKHSESHTMLDFTVGQDVGLGMFGLEGSSVISGGIRWANFSGKTLGNFSYGRKYFSREIHRTFNGIGPVIKWDASTPIATEFSLDWGVSGAVLFGPRKVRVIAPIFSPRSHDGTVPQVGAYLGAGWHQDGCPVTVRWGYAVQANWTVFDGDFSTYSGHNNVDRLWHGPYLDVTVPLN
jgi:hypothetical protein